MPLRQTIGISLAFLVISAGANAKDPKETPLHHHGHLHAAKHEKARTAAAKPHGWAHLRAAARHARPTRRHRLAAAHARGEALDADWGAVRPAGEAEVGEAVWYRRIGARTASGERLDDVTPTAAHRTLPLNSLAKVTDLDNGRSVIVRINDRGPVSHRLLIDLSPRAADELHMKSAGVAAVRIEPVVEEAAPNDRPAAAVAAYYGTSGR